MRIKVRTGLFFLFGIQGVMQVVYWEVIKGYPACWMCKGYRFLYLSILITTLMYRYRASFFRLAVMCGLIFAETVWSLWDVIQEVELTYSKCHSMVQMIDGKAVLIPCMAGLSSGFNVLSSAVGINAVLSIAMCGYAVGVLRALRTQRYKARGYHRGKLLAIMLFPLWSTADASGVDAAFKKALDQQEKRAKTYDVTPIREASQQHETRYHGEAEALVKAAAASMNPANPTDGGAQAPCSGKCPSFKPVPDTAPQVQVCMSFSVPSQVWKELNEDLARHEGVFVVNGLPNNSFEAFTDRVLDLRKQGITVPIRIDPKLFERFKVQHVPLFVVTQREETHTVSGTLTLPYVLGLMHIKRGDGK